MTYQDISVATEDRVLTLTLNRPDKLNAWTHRMESEFRQAVEAAEADDQVRAIVVTGAGLGALNHAALTLEALAHRGRRPGSPPVRR